MKKFKRFFLGIILLLLCLVSFAGIFFYVVGDKYVVPIVMYHHVEPLDHQEANWVSPELFEWQMAFLRRYKYNVISLADLVLAIEQNKSLPRNSVVITFDDGYQDNYEYAFPVLKKYKIPAIIFMIGGVIDEETFSNSYGLLVKENFLKSQMKMKEEKFLTITQMREMIKAGMQIGSHGVHGMYLYDFDLNGQQWQIEQSKKILENALGNKIDFFAYPIGGFSEEIKQMLRSAGYKAACATNRGHDRLNTDLFELKRIRLSNSDDNPIELWIKLSGYYNFFRKMKNPF